MRAIALFLTMCVLGATAGGCTSKPSADSANSSFTTVGAKIGATNGEATTLPDASVPIAKSPWKSGDMAKDGLKDTPAKDGAAKDALDGGSGGEIPTSLPAPKGVFDPRSADKKADGGGKSETPPAVAEAVVGREMPKKPREPQLQSGILTAGSFDDNINPQVFGSFLKRMSQARGLGDFLTRMQGQRVLVIVKDANGKPVGDARVRLSAGASAPVEVLTRTDGRAVFMLALDQLPENQNLLVSVTGPNGGNPVAETITAGASRWEVTLPGVQAALPKNLDLCILLDTTGSMGDELNHLKAEIRGISQAIAHKFPEVKQRFSLVLYRDEGDDYVARRFDFTDSLDTFHKNLSAQSAGGGGDYPEAMHKGLEESLQLRWQEKDAARVMFLVGDAPPHAQHMNRTLAAVNNLRKKAIAIYPVACSGYNDDCEIVMRSSAMLTGSQFLFLTDDSGVGGSHAEPKIPYYHVERLEKLMTRMIASELSGVHLQPNAADIIRTVGKKVN